MVEPQHIEEYVAVEATYPKIKRASDRLKALEEELERAYGRWDELESLAAKFSGEPGE